MLKKVELIITTVRLSVHP